MKEFDMIRKIIKLKEGLTNLNMYEYYDNSILFNLGRIDVDRAQKIRESINFINLFPKIQTSIQKFQELQKIPFPKILIAYSCTGNFLGKSNIEKTHIFPVRLLTSDMLINIFCENSNPYLLEFSKKLSEDKYKTFVINARLVMSHNKYSQIFPFHVGYFYNYDTDESRIHTYYDPEVCTYYSQEDVQIDSENLVNLVLYLLNTLYINDYHIKKIKIPALKNINIQPYKILLN